VMFRLPEKSNVGSSDERFTSMGQESQPVLKALSRAKTYRRYCPSGRLSGSEELLAVIFELSSKAEIFEVLIKQVESSIGPCFLMSTVSPLNFISGAAIAALLGLGTTSGKSGQGLSAR